MEEVVKQENTELSGDFSEKLAQFNPVDLKAIYTAVMDEAGEVKLDNEARKAACEELGVDMATAQGWQTVSDITKHLDLSELCEKHPEAAKSILVTTLSAVSVACPAVAVGAIMAKAIPTPILTKVMGISLKASPDHIAHVIADYCTNKRRETLSNYEIEEETLGEKKNLVVVCKDDLLFDQLKKLIETNDDEEGEVVGTKDGTVRLLRWSADKWAYLYSVNKITDKVLVIGDVTGVKNQPDVMDAKMDEFGIKYGWIGNVAYISAKRSALLNKTAYAEFADALNALEVPEEVKKDKRFKLDVKTGLKAALLTPILIKDAIDDTTSVLRQQYFYGTFKFYYTDLEQFINE